MRNIIIKDTLNIKFPQWTPLIQWRSGRLAPPPLNTGPTWGVSGYLQVSAPLLPGEEPGMPV